MLVPTLHTRRKKEGSIVHLGRNPMPGGNVFTLIQQQMLSDQYGKYGTCTPEIFGCVASCTPE